MPELPEVPEIGKLKVKKPVVITVVIGVGIVGYLWWRNHSATDAATLDPNAVDPLTGLTYGVESGQPTGVNSASGTGGEQDTVDASGTGIHDGASWTADVVDKLGGSYDPAALYDALGAYLAGQEITADQAVIVRSAWAASGKPPGGPDTYRLTQSGGGTPGAGSGATGAAPAAPVATSVTKSSVKLSTVALAGASSYEWAVNGADHAHTPGPSYTYAARPGTRYTFSVRAIVNGHDTAQSGTTTVTTKAA
jgi:hypothetical protein